MERFETHGQSESAEEKGPQEGSESESAPEEDFDTRQESVELRNERVQQEVQREGEVTKEQVSETLWKHPVQFVEDVISGRLVPYFRKFLKRFGSTEDDALATEDMREVRDQAKEAAEDEAE